MEGEICSISYPYFFGWMNFADTSKMMNGLLRKLNALSELEYVPLANLRYQVDNGFLKYKGRIVLSPTSLWREKNLP